MIPLDPSVLALLAAEFGTLAGPPDEAEYRRWDECETWEEADARHEAADAESRRRRGDMRRRLWSVMHRLPADEAMILQGIASGQSHAHIAEQLGCCRSAITERLPTIINRVRFWVGLPALPEHDELLEHLGECCPRLGRRQPGRIVAYVEGTSLREIARDHGGRDHAVIRRSIKRGMEQVRAASRGCKTCKAIVTVYEARAGYRPPQAGREVDQ